MNRIQTRSHSFQVASRFVLYGILTILPLFFLPFTLDPLEINKQSLLLIGVCISFVLLIASILLNKETRVQLSFVKWIPLLLCGAFVASATFSLAPYTSWVGTGGQEYMSVLTWIGLGLLFYLITLFEKELEITKKLWLLLIASAALTGLIGILTVFGVPLFPFFPTLAKSAFNTIGTMNLLAVYLIVMSLFACSVLVTPQTHHELFTKKGFRLGMFIVISVLFFETVILLLVLDYALLWILLVLGCALLFSFAIFRSRSFPSFIVLYIPVIFTVIGLTFWFFLPGPFSVKLPIEVTPSFGSSVQATSNSLKGNQALFGTGPGTYGIDFAKYHSISINETDFWNTRFDRAASFVFTLAPTVGYVGTGLYLLFVFALFYLSILKLVLEKKDVEWVQLIHVFIPWFTLTLASFLFPFNFTLIVSFILFSALLCCALGQKDVDVKFSQNKAVALLSSVCFVAFIFMLFIGIFFTTGRYSAEISYAKAVRADRTKADTKVLVAKLDHAATLNKWNDDYFRNLSAALLLRVQDELKTFAPNAQMTDVQKNYLQALVAASVNASARATILSPNEVSNWLVRGEVYRSLTGLVDKSATFSLEAYKHATELEPLNPNHWNELGKTQMAIADALQPVTISKDPTVAAQAKKEWQSALDEAENDFIKATELKSNYAPAHYQMALVYERENKLNEAIGKLERVLKYNDADIGVGFELGNLYTKRGGNGDLDRARKVFEHVVTLAPSYSDAHWFLASLYEKLGNKDAAIKEIQTVLKLNPNNQIVKTRLQKLQSIAPSP